MKLLAHKMKAVALLILLACQLTFAQKNIENQISDSLTLIANSYVRVGKVNLVDFQLNAKSNSIIIKANDRLGYIPFRPENVSRIYNAIRKILPSKYSNYSIICQVENQNIENLIPNFYRTQNIDPTKQFSIPSAPKPLVINTSRPYQITSGLANRHLALWQSHGWYFDQKLTRWEWQRGRIFQVVEDLYTQSYVLPYLVPMLENAGATTLLPRERDTQLQEIIVDNDIKIGNSRYREHNDRKSWKSGEGIGFANPSKFYIQGENPFTLGTFRVNKTVTDSNETSSIYWTPDIPETGRYAVYVSYKTLENSTKDARYTILHKGGKTDFTVNQTMNGGTWLYLGHFYFDKGRTDQNKVILTNLSTEEGKVITADATKFGGGMGNIARYPSQTNQEFENKKTDLLFVSNIPIKPIYEPETSTYPRFTEAARYWLQWAGIPDSIYSKSKGTNDYTDDFQSRGLWVNYLAGGSAALPNTKGLGIPIDLAFAFHTDAGTTMNDSIIGTLGIFSVQNSDKKTFFANGISRWASRDLTDIIQTQIVNDIRSLYAPEWTRRELWNKSYSESRLPEVPTMLLELLSHQNFADMRYGLDPQFRFAVSRSIYKGILKYLSSTNNTQYAVQPLPVKQFSCKFIDKNKLELHWISVIDSLEPTAIPEQYVLYTRVNNGGFDNGLIINSNRTSITIEPGKIYSFKITAVNKGGESFPSETLSAYRAANERGEVLIVNGFDRLSGPASFTLDSNYAGFLNDEDPGIPYLSDISFVGKQYEFKRNKWWVDDDAPGFGASYANFETKEIAGNSFDYPFLHGKAIKASGFSFVSCSSKAIMSGEIDMNKYKIVDLILGKQKQTILGNAKKAPEFKTFPLALQQAIKSYCQNGGNLMLSGSFIGSDIYESNLSTLQDKQFFEDVLKLKFRTSKACVGGQVKVVNSPFRIFDKMEFAYFNQPNSVSYYLESADAIEPNEKNGYTIARYSENNLSAAVAYATNYKLCVFGFPFETIQSEVERSKLMESILMFFSAQK